MTETFQSAVINYLRYKMVVTVWCGRARQVLTSALSSTSGMNRTADSESDLMVTITSTCGGKTEPCSDHWNWLDVVFCSQFVFIIRRVLLGHLNREYLRETDRERDTGVSRPTCWFYYSQIQLHHNKQDSNRKLKCFCRGQQEKSDRASEVSSPDESCSVEHEATKVQLPGWKMTRRVSSVETCTGLLVSRAR